MLFDVVTLFRDGRRRPRFEVLAAVPVRGRVSVDAGSVNGHVATLSDATDRVRLLLLGTRIIRMTRSALVLQGVEATNDGSGYTLRQEQEWWCRLPDGPAPQPWRPAPTPTPVGA